MEFEATVDVIGISMQGRHPMTLHLSFEKKEDVKEFEWFMYTKHFLDYRTFEITKGKEKLTKEDRF